MLDTALAQLTYIVMGLMTIIVLIIMFAMTLFYFPVWLWNIVILPILNVVYFFTKSRYSDDEPLSAHKRARLVHDNGTLKAYLRPIHHDIKLESIGSATCLGGHRHTEVPGDECNCGFYGLKYNWLLVWNPSTASYSYITNIINLVDLDVELYGKIIESVAGYRAQHQRILCVKLPKRCKKRYCLRKTAHVVLANALGIRVISPEKRLYLVCDKHSKNELGYSYEPCISITDLADQLGTEVALR